jgi:hypothetical protein
MSMPALSVGKPPVLAPSVAPVPAVAPASAVSSVVAVADVDGRADADALVRGEALADADVDGTTTLPLDADALADGDALVDGDEDALAEVAGDDEPAALDDAGAGELAAGVPQAASTASTNASNIVIETRCFIRFCYSSHKKKQQTR